MKSFTSVSMYPARARENDNPFINILSRGLAANDVEVRAYIPGWPQPLADAFHVHWLERIFWGRLASRSTWIQRHLADQIVSAGTKYRAAFKPVVWTAHNLRPHDGLSDEKKVVFDKLTSGFMPLVTDVVIMDESIAEVVRSTYPQLRDAHFHLIPHPNFTEEFSRHKPFRDARAQYSVPPAAPLLVSIGKIRAYKGLPALVRVLRKTSCDFRLVIAGDGDAGEVAQISAEAGNDQRFVMDIRTLEASEVAGLFGTADAAVFNFTSILNSGSVLSALSASTPVICPNVGALAGLAKALGEHWVRTYQAPLTSSVIEREIRSLRISDPLVCDLSASSPLSVGAQHAAIYRGAMGGASTRV